MAREDVNSFVLLDSTGNVIEFEVNETTLRAIHTIIDSKNTIQRGLNKTQLTKYIKDYIDRKGHPEDDTRD